MNGILRLGKERPTGFGLYDHIYGKYDKLITRRWARKSLLMSIGTEILTF